MDVDRAKSAEKRAEDRLAAHAVDIDTTRAEAALQRALRRLDVAEKYGKQ
ncbi:ATP synthase delta/epsilon chain alpha-helix domain-containing protein [uncultured Megasphaera sp.]|nr:ATP synthase delta/epsilon chain alpha-helix domain-containing protein [uncultured Megasphaera sp.]